MSVLEAIILGIVQGLTEFLPVSSSGHIELGKALLNMGTDENMLFSLVVHGATVLSILIVFREDILQLLKGLFQFSWNEQTKYIFLLLLSMIPLVILGLGFKEEVASLFTGNLFLVGCMLLFTALLLQLTRFEKENTKMLGIGSVLLIGLAQAVAVVPGISRSGATISTALALGASREEAARFSFLMILIPILGANFLQLLQMGNAPSSSIETLPLIAGFLGAFISGLFACKVMVALVKKGKIIYFSIYCLIVGAIAIFASF